jgi:phage terminase large subunit-like protein
VFGGLDLSESRDLTALVLAHCDVNGVWHVRPIFWLPADSLVEKGARDHAPYDLWAEQGDLETTRGAAVSYEVIAERLREIFDDYRVERLAYDPWHWQQLRPCLARVGFSEHMLEMVFVPFGQGYKSMSPALRGAETIILERKLRHGDHPVLNMCIANATVERDAAGNRKLSKKRSTGRIDGAVALVMALGVAPTGWTRKFDAAALIG